MKELLVSFFACLVIGAIINGFNTPAPSAAPPVPSPESAQKPHEQPPGDAAPGDASGSSSGTEPTGGAEGVLSDGNAGAQKNPLSSTAPETGDNSFDQDVLKSQVPVLVDFGDARYEACRIMAPIVDKLYAEYSGRAKVFKLDMDRNPTVREKFQVKEMPTFMMFRDGRPVAHYTGTMTKEMLAGVIDHQLGTQ